METVKLVFLGRTAVGKSSIVQRYLTDTYDPLQDATIGAAFQVKRVTLPDGRRVKVEIWDTAGQERFEALVPMYYRSSDGVVLVYDVTDRASYTRAERYLKTLRETNTRPQLVLVLANKTDLDGYRVVSDTELPVLLKKDRLETTKGAECSVVHSTAEDPTIENAINGLLVDILNLPRSVPTGVPVAFDVDDVPASKWCLC